MYVLHHADQPQLYNGLPHNPHISPAVRLWKGLQQSHSRSSRIMALTALAGFFHFIRVGRNEITEADEAAAARLDAEGGAAPPSAARPTPEKRT